MKIAVLCGGESPERNVSLSSGAMIANALRTLGHTVCLADTLLGINEFRFTAEPQTVPPVGSEADTPCRLGRSVLGRGIIELCKLSDAVFLALHGGIGEDGCLAGLLECVGVPYTGAGVLSSAAAMDKSVTKILLKNAGVTVPDGMVLRSFDADSTDLEGLKLPCVMKPCSGGSSVGVSFFSDKKCLLDALKCTFSPSNPYVLEQKITGRELTVGVIDGTALPAVEIIPKTGFYDYINKYIPGRTDELCPAPITDAEAKMLSDAALTAAEALGIKSYCRVDFILSDGVPYCLEVNTLPGMTATSLLPQAAAAAGISFPDLCGKILQTALEGRH